MRTRSPLLEGKHAGCAGVRGVDAENVPRNTEGTNAVLATSRESGRNIPSNRNAAFSEIYTLPEHLGFPASVIIQYNPVGTIETFNSKEAIGLGEVVVSWVSSPEADLGSGAARIGGLDIHINITEALEERRRIFDHSGLERESRF